jgi:hypothetical protein
MLDPNVIHRIRHIFLHPRPHVSINTASHLLGWTGAEMKAAIAAGEVELLTTPLGKWVWREELMTKALEQWALETIEAALGDDAERVLPEAIRTCELRARVPRYQVAMLEHLAELDGTTVSHVLTRELEDVASAKAEMLSSAIPGFAAALAWPVASEAEAVC